MDMDDKVSQMVEDVEDGPTQLIDNIEDREQDLHQEPEQQPEPEVQSDDTAQAEDTQVEPGEQKSYLSEPDPEPERVKGEGRTVPLPELLKEREKRQAAERRAAELEQSQQAV